MCRTLAHALLLAMLLASVSLTTAVAQDDEPTSPSDVDPPTLPEVVVEPEAGDDEMGDDGMGTIDPVIVTPDEDLSDFPNIDPSQDINLAFPSLADQMTGSPDGGGRGGPISIFDNPRAADVVTQQQLAESGATDLGSALEQTTGVLIQRTGRGQSSPFIRGLTGQQVLILVDGIRMTNATFRAGPNQYLNTIDPNMVERIEVIRGPGSVAYGGDAIGGVINVITKSPITGYDVLRGSTVQRFSSYDLGYTGRLNVEGSIGATGFFAGAGYGTYNDLDTGGVLGRQPATSWRYNSADVKFTHQLNDCSQLIFALQRYQAEDVFRSDRFPQNRVTIFDPQQRDLYYLRWQGVNDCCCSWINSWQITGSFHDFKEGRIDERPTGTLEAIREFTDEQTGVNAVFTTCLGRLGTVTWGGDWYHDDIDAQVQDFGVRPDGLQFPDDAFYSRYGAFLLWDVELTCRLRALSGVRYEHVTAGGTVTAGNPAVTGFIDPEYQDVMGQLGLTYEVSECVHLVGSISEGFRAPNLDDLTATNGNVFLGTQLPNPSLTPETSITYEVGVKVNDECFRGQVFVWWTDLQDHILRSPPTGAPGSQVLERANVQSELQGVEASAERLLGCGWSLYGNFWYTFGRNDEGPNAVEPLSRIPPTQGIVGMRWRDECGQWLDVYAWLVDRQDRLSARDVSDARIPDGGTPGYGTLNFRAGRLISDRSRIALNVENILDKQYRVHGSGSDGPGVGAIVTYELLR